MKNVILVLLTVSVIGLSCQQDDPPQPPVLPVADKYMTLTPASTWNYEFIDKVADDTSAYVLTSTSRDSTIDAKAYHVFTNSSGSDNEYYNITGNEYYTLRSLPTALGGSSAANVYLKDNAVVNDSWSTPYPVTVSGIPLIATVTHIIAAKGMSMTVKGNTYADVIHVTTTVTVAGVPASGIITNINSYYAPKYGLIQSSNKISLNYLGITGETDEETNLVSADLK